MREAGFVASTTPEPLAVADTVVICVPTGLTGDGLPDLSAVRAAAATLAGRLRPGTLVVLESTSFPGTTEEVVRPILESGGLIAGVDFALGYSPERIDPGNPRYPVDVVPKVVSGVTALCAKRCAAFYEALVDSVVVASGTREAEMAKLLENAYRHVNIALVNELAMVCDRLGVDVWEVIRCAATKPYGFQEFRPGPGAGGHCIPVDSRYLSHSAATAGLPCTLVEAASLVNDRMPGYVVTRIRDAIRRAGAACRGARVLLLGVTYKPDVADLRESPAVAVVRGLRAAGIDVTYHDPLIPEFTVDGQRLEPVADPAAAAACSTVTVLLQDHTWYDLEHLARSARVLLDTRGRVGGERVERL